MTLSAVHRPLNPPFRRAPGASVRPRLLAFFVGGSVFAPLFADQKAAKDPPVEDCDRYFLRKKGTKLPRHRRGFLATFDTKKYKVPRGRRPRLTADQKAANNISRRLRSVLFATQQHLEIPATGAVPGRPFPQNQSLFSALEPDLRLLVWWSREKSLPLKVICSNR